MALWRCFEEGVKGECNEGIACGKRIFGEIPVYVVPSKEIPQYQSNEHLRSWDIRSLGVSLKCPWL